MQPSDLNPLSEKTVKVVAITPPDKDATVIQLILYCDGKGYYAKIVEWEEFEPFEVLDLSNLTFPGVVKVDIADWRSARLTR